MQNGLLPKLLACSILGVVGAFATTFVQAGNPQVGRAIQVGIGLATLLAMAKVFGVY